MSCMLSEVATGFQDEGSPGGCWMPPVMSTHFFKSASFWDCSSHLSRSP